MQKTEEELQNCPILTKENLQRPGDASEKLEEQKESIENLNIDALPPKELISRAYEPTKVLLFTSLPKGSSELDLLQLLKTYGKVLDIYFLENKPCCYVEFEVV